MLAKLTALALVLPYVAALTISTPSGVSNAGTMTITWTASTTDPTSFSIELVQASFHDTFAIANNVPTNMGQLTVQVPQVPITDGYTLQAFANNNINTVYSTSGSFAIGGPVSSSTTAVSVTSSATSASSGSLTTPSTTGTATATIPVSLASSSASGSSTTASSTPSTFSSSGAASLKLIGMAPAAALVLSAVAGAAMVF